MAKHSAQIESTDQATKESKLLRSRPQITITEDSTQGTSRVADWTSKFGDSLTLIAKQIVKERQAEGLEVFDFGLGETKGELLQEIKDAAHEAYKQQKTGYNYPAGISELRNAILPWMGLEDHYSEENVVVTVGAKQALYNTFAALCDPGDTVLIEAAPWVSYVPLAHCISAKPVVVEPADPAKSHFKVTPEDLERTLYFHKKAKLFLLNSPCNPTGQFYSQSELDALLEICVQNKVFFAIDRLYWKVVFDGREFPSLPTTGPKSEWIIHIDGLSKNFRCTGGLRIGWTVAPRDASEAMIRIQSHTTSGPSTPAQWAAVAALTKPYDREMIIDLEKKRDLLWSLVQDMPHVKVFPTEAAYYSFWDVRGAFGKKTPDGQILKNTIDVSTYLLNSQGVVTVPGEAFERPGYLRLMFHIDEATIREGMSRARQAFMELS